MNPYSCYYEATVRGKLVKGTMVMRANSPRQARTRVYDAIVDIFDAIVFIDAEISDDTRARQRG